MRPTLKTIAKQQVLIETLAKGLDTIADAAGIDLSPIKAEGHRRVSSIQSSGYVLPVGSDTNPEYPTRCTNCDRPVEKLSVFPGGKCIDCHADVTPMPTAQEVVELWGGEWKGATRRHADTRNPANPIPEPAPGQTPFSTEETATPEARVDVTSPGGVGVDGTSPDAHTDVETAETIDIAPLPLAEDDVETPVAGTTEPHDGKIEGEVRIDDAHDDKPFPDLQTSSSVSGARLMAGIRLARQRISVGITSDTDDITLGHSIAASHMSDSDIRTEITALERVASASGSNTPIARNLVPRTASGSRSTPSMGGGLSDSGGNESSSVPEPLW